MKNVWESHISSELLYWKSMIDGSFHNKEWVEGFKRRVAGIDIFPQHLRKYLYDGCKILDVGSGPATVLGGIDGGKTLDVTAIDPLADEYMKLYIDHNIRPQVSVIKGDAENLPAIVKGKFNFVYSRNALDHSYDPLRAIQSMLDVCVVGGTVFFENVINEGNHENYSGLHQWNFMPASGNLVIWNREGEAWIVGEELHDRFKTLKAFIIREGWVAVEICM